jgi:hypothetical protein
MTEPPTPLHYTANRNFVNGQYAPVADSIWPTSVRPPNSAKCLRKIELPFISRHDGRRDSRVQGGRRAVHRQLEGPSTPIRSRRMCRTITTSTSSRSRFRRPNRSAFRRRTWCRSIRPSAAAVMRRGSYPRPRRSKRSFRMGLRPAEPRLRLRL